MDKQNKNPSRKTALVAIAPQGESDPWHTHDEHYEHLAALLAGPCRLDVHFAGKASFFTRENIARHDLLILWTIHNHQADWALANMFAAVAEDGIPLLSLHGGLWSAGASYGDTGRRALGCVLYPACHHLAFQRFEVHLSGGSHPVARELSDFAIEDEPYLVDILDENAQVLAYFSTSEVELFNSPDPNNVYAQKGDEWARAHAKAPLLYTRSLGKGSIVVNALGHDQRALSNPHYRQLVKQSVEFLVEQK